MTFTGSNSFTHNRAVDGGAIYIVRSNLNINGNIEITSNIAADIGGGVWAFERLVVSHWMEEVPL